MVNDVFVATTKHVKERKAGGEKAFNKNLLGDYFHTLFPPSPVSYVDVEDGERGWLWFVSEDAEFRFKTKMVF